MSAKKFLLVLVLLVTVGLGYVCSRPSRGEPGYNPPVSAYATKVPPSYTTRWLENDEFDCGYYDKCVGLEFVSRVGCDNLYVEVTILDANGNNVDWTNDTASGVRAGEKVHLVFGWSGEGTRARVAEVSCH